MTIKELIEKLQEMPADTRIKYFNSHTADDYYLQNIIVADDKSEVYINIHLA